MAGKLQTRFSIAALCCLTAPVFAANPTEDYCNGADDTYHPPHHGWYVTWENDAIGFPKSDHGYTQGAQAGYTYKNSDLPTWVNRANSWLCEMLRFSPSGVDRAKAQSSSSLFLGQQLFTPVDTERFDPIPDDRPYAGWLYGGGRIDLVQALELSSKDHRRWQTHTFELHMGVVGSHALGRETQQNFHELFGDHKQVNGWHNQLGNRFAAQGYYNYSRRLTSFGVGSMVSDVLLGGSAGIGTLQLYGDAGLTLRLGRNMGPLSQRAILPTISTISLQPLPVDAPSLPNREDPPSEELRTHRMRLNQSSDARSCTYFRAIECYVFFGVSGRGVAKNEFLDAASSGGGSAIDTESFIYDISFGARLRYEAFRFDFISTRRSREFSSAAADLSGDNGSHGFGSLTVSCYGSYGGYDGYWQFLCPSFVGVMVGLLALQ